jgi:glycolate oxidase
MMNATIFENIVGKENVRSDEIERLCYSRDMSIHEGVPDAVIFARDRKQVVGILKIANKERIPVITRGSGTSVTGAVLAMGRGIILDLSRMNQIRKINKRSCYVQVEPGVICANLNAALVPTHFFPPDPASATLASIGGMVSTNASGNRALKYGTTRDYILAMEVVLADGRVLKTGTIAPKTSSGYELSHLFATSEGTLGIMTELTMKILPMPEYTAYAQARFPDIDSAGRTVEMMLTAGIPLSSCEILDDVSIGVVNQAMGLNIPPEVGCILFIEIDGTRRTVQDHMNEIDTICNQNGGLENIWDDDPAKRQQMWAGRQGLVPSLSKIRRGARLMNYMEDFGVPIERIPDTIREIQRIGKKHNFPIGTFGHVGDGNLHAVIVMDPRNREEWDTLRKIGDDFIEMTNRFKGTFSAEHGVGMAKSPYIKQELGIGLEIMERIKGALDPNNILNPGKMGFQGSPSDVFDHSAYRPFIESPENIVSFGSDVDNEILACIQCGFCRAGCPTYRETSLESINARGRIILSYYLLTGRLQPSEDLARRFYSCSVCLNCKAVCPAGVMVSDIVEAARARLVEAGCLPQVHQAMIHSIQERGNPFGEASDKRTELYPTEYAPKERAATLLYFGCMASYQDVHTIPSTLAILDKAGIDYTTLGNKEDCCGYISYLVGERIEFDRCLEKNVNLFQTLDIKEIVTTCAGCYRTFKNLYSRHSAMHGTRVFHAVEYMESLLSENKIRVKNRAARRVAYHDPCDMGRHMNIYEPPRKLIGAIPGVELIEFAKNRNLATCCGGGGGLKAYDTAMSLDIAYRRVQEAVLVGVDTIVSACPSCRSNLQQGAARLRREKMGKIKVMDITELLSRSLA